MAKIYVDVPVQFLGRYDGVLKKAGYNTRSDALREAMRDHLDSMVRGLSKRMKDDLEEEGVL